VNRAFNTSMEVGVRVEIEDYITGKVFHSNSAYLTFVAIDRYTQRAIPVPEIIPETEEEKRRFDQALQRRDQRIQSNHGIIQTKTKE